MPNILVISALQVFPPLSGGNRRTAMLAEGLAEHGHDVRVYSLIGRKADMLKGVGPGEAILAPKLHEYVERPKATWFTAMVAYRYNLPPLWAKPALTKPSKRLKVDLEWAEVLVFDFPFVSFVPDKSETITVLNTHNVETKLYGGSPWRERYMVPKVDQIEREALGFADLICCSSEEEVAAFSSTVGTKPILHVPNCIDQRRFQNLASQRSLIRNQLGLDSTTRALFFPASAYGPNREGFEFLRDFAATQEHLLNELQITFIITGSVTKSPLRTHRLVATGPVPEVDSYFAAADWGVIPTFQGSGTSIKVAEMIGAGLPLFTTEFGVRGFNLTAGRSAVVFDRETFAQQLVALPRDEETLRSLAATAAQANAGYLEPTAAVAPLAQLLREIYARRMATRSD